MPLQQPSIDNRKYKELLDEALARIPVHTREWTNFNKSDPGITLIELFAFMTENLLYRVNQIPERNRLKFLSLLGIPLQVPSSAKGIVSFSIDSGPLATVTLGKELELMAGAVPFRTPQGLDVLPVEGRVYFKRPITMTPQLKAYYQQLYASYSGSAPFDELNLNLYETVPLEAEKGGVNLGDGTVDKALWLALLVRPRDRKEAGFDLDGARKALCNKVLNLGIAPVFDAPQQRMMPGGHANPEVETLLQYRMPKLPPDLKLPLDPAKRVPEYRNLDYFAPTDVLAEPGVVQITLPASKDEMSLWQNLDPLEQGVGDFPPAIMDSRIADRIITWIRIGSSAPPKVTLLWAGINAVPILQKATIVDERLPDGTGEPDQKVKLSKTPVIPGSVRLLVQNPKLVEDDLKPWEEIEDLYAAGPEVPVPDLRNPPGQPTMVNDKVNVFWLDSESGEIRFGDGLRGMRPQLNAVISASYDYGVGRDGNVNAGAIKEGPGVPAGIKATNPIPTWGGAEGETAADGEKRISSFLQHRDRLVSAEDFRNITLRTPGVDIARVEVIPTYNPELRDNQPGDAPGAVTLMIIPKYDLRQPDAPQPDALFIETVCSYLDPRRLVTTEVFLRGPSYKKIWISAGINVIAAKSTSVAEVRETVRNDVFRFLSPLPVTSQDSGGVGDVPFMYYPGGWPLWNPVDAKELMAVISRVNGVSKVNRVLLSEAGQKDSIDQVLMEGLELPQVMALSITIGEPMPLDQFLGAELSSGGATAGTAARPSILPVPMFPEECK